MDFLARCNRHSRHHHDSRSRVPHVIFIKFRLRVRVFWRPRLLPPLAGGLLRDRQRPPLRRCHVSGARTARAAHTAVAFLLGRSQVADWSTEYRARDAPPRLRSPNTRKSKKTKGQLLLLLLCVEVIVVAMEDVVTLVYNDPEKQQQSTAEDDDGSEYCKNAAFFCDTYRWVRRVRVIFTDVPPWLGYGTTLLRVLLSAGLW